MVLAMIFASKTLAFYLKFDLFLVFSMLLIPFVIYSTGVGERSYRYFIPSLICFALYPLLKVQSCFYFGFFLFLIFIFESHFGKTSPLLLILIVLMSPLSIFAFEQLGFPIRLLITELSTAILQNGGYDIYSKGNIIHISGEVFIVDDACIGLKMVNTTYLIALCLITTLLPKGKKLNLFTSLIPLFTIATLLIIIGNFIRILTIIILKSYPETISHELIGIFSLILYVCLPLLFITHIWIQKFALADRQTYNPKKRMNPYSIYGYSSITIIYLAYIFFGVEQFKPSGEDPREDQIVLNGFEKSILKTNVIKFKNEDALVYVKAPAPFYGSDHSPMICWKGSGYTIQGEQKMAYKNYTFFVAELSSDHNHLYTTWWYDNGDTKTHSQINWRLHSINGEENFRLINVTANSKQDAIKVSKAIMETSLFKTHENKPQHLTTKIDL